MLNKPKHNDSIGTNRLNSPIKEIKNGKAKNIVCPFCSLLCDDLEINHQNGQLSVLNSRCGRTKKMFEEAPITGDALVKGKKSSLQDAIAESAKLLKRAKQPLMTGLGTDLLGMRAAMQVAEQSGAIMDHMYGDKYVRNTYVLQSSGWIMTTMAEIRNRGDLVIFAGTDTSNYPSFIDRTIANEKSLFDLEPANRQLVYIGEDLNTRAGSKATKIKPIHLKCEQKDISLVISALHSEVLGYDIGKAEVCGIKPKIIKDLAAKMKTANYGVIVWEYGALNFPHAELTIDSFRKVIAEMNKESRFAGFSLGGNDGGVTAHNVCTWQSGYPLRVNFKKGYPEFDPEKHSTQYLLDNDEVDAMLWISSFDSSILPPKTKIPTIILGRPDLKLSFKPDVFIPIGTPGVDHKGHLFRTDSVVSLPLTQLRNATNSSVSDVLTAINALLR